MLVARRKQMVGIDDLNIAISESDVAEPVIIKLLERIIEDVVEKHEEAKEESSSEESAVQVKVA